MILFRGLRGRLSRERVGNMPWLFFLAALAIPAFYAVGLLARSDRSFTVADFWRFWVVHLWVEDFLELFTTVMVAYLFVLLGVVREKVALTVVLLDVLLYSVGGVVGTMHHLYFSGEPAEHMALGAVFSAAEVIPLTFLTVEAWSFLQLGSRQESRSRTPFPHRWAVMFLVAVGFWNFLGAGIFGFLINLPIVSYYEIGTALTANHGHTAMMGVYGMLAAGLALFCLRYLIPAERWPERAAKISFWSLNIGLAWMSFATLFPLGIRQLYESVNPGYFEARSLDYLGTNTNTVIEWLRLPGDVLFIAGGVIPSLHLLRRRSPHRQASHLRGARGAALHRADRAEGAGREPVGERGGNRGPARGGLRHLPGLAALGVDLLARHSHRRSTATGPPASDFTSTSTLGVPRGRAPAPGGDRPPAAGWPTTVPELGSATLPAEGSCTDSDDGREIARPLDPWPHSEAGRFHRGIALVLVVLAGLMIARRRRAEPRPGGPRGPWSRPGA